MEDCLSSYAHLNARELHSRYLNRLYTSRDYEAGLVNMMKERYEVTSKHYKFSYTVYQLHCSPQGSVYLFKMNRDLLFKTCPCGIPSPLICLINYTLAPKCQDEYLY